MRSVWFGLATIDLFAFIAFLVIGDLTLMLLTGAFALVFFVLGLVDRDEASTRESAPDPRIEALDDTVKTLERRLESLEKNRRD